MAAKPFIFSACFFSDDGELQQLSADSTKSVYSPAAPVTLVSCWQERTGGRERTPPFPIAALTPGSRKACNLFELCSLSSDGGSWVVLFGPAKGLCPRQSTVRIQKLWILEFPLVALCVPLSSLFSIKKSWELKWLVVLILTLFLASFWGTFLKFTYLSPHFSWFTFSCGILCIIVSYLKLFLEKSEIFFKV